MREIYLDCNASTPIDPAVADAMRPFLEQAQGNPSSLHWAGRPARAAVDHARSQVAALIGAEAREIVFTSGGSEASNHALKGYWFRHGRPGGHFITSSVEHPATLNPLRFLERLGAEVTVLPVDRFGRVDPGEVERALRPDTLLVSLMHSNNEVGTLQPIAEVGALTRARGVRFHVDGAQSVGKVPLDVGALGIDLLSIAGHKLYAPKGVGALYLRRGVELEPLVHGAGHEEGRRAGTENVLLAVGLGAACDLAHRFLDHPEGEGGPEAIRVLRDRFEQTLRARFGAAVTFNGHPDLRLPNTASVNFVGSVGADLLASLDGVAASTGSACHAGSVELSGVLRAMGVPPEEGMGAIRFSLGRATTWSELATVLDLLSARLGGQA
ncbi:MAG: cysteine desulfurase [Candidatus Eisenbacteria bacterium]|nr:cysteine desulfurase [Candidatus Eisenbacteria bacterium]